ncbi:hypothetical protein GGI20_001608 [Coemansia sp. BCRC 34301]|nr:hypothetical protein GGI20_001608 [Coemansia sp. BCRC 34301]
MKTSAILFALVATASAATIYVHNPNARDEALTERKDWKKGALESLDADDIHPVPKLNADDALPATNAPRRGRMRPAMGNPTAKTQATPAAARNLNKEVHDALVNPEVGAVADNSFSALLLKAIESSHGDLAIISI